MAHDLNEASDGGGSPESLRDDLEQFFASGLGRILPCARCRDHYRELLADGGALRTSLSLALEQRALFDWSVELHNRVSAHVAAERGRAPPDPWTPLQAKLSLALNGRAVAIAIGVGAATVVVVVAVALGLCLRARKKMV